MKQQIIVTALAILSCIRIAAGAAAAEGRPVSYLPSPGKVDFMRDIQPILSERCFSCHGPEKQKSGLRLDTKAGAFAGGDSGKSIVAGDSGASVLYRYVARLDREIKMPPKGAPLASNEVALIRTWIDQGAEWSSETAALAKPRHWSFQQPNRPPLPPVKNHRWVRNAIDQFVLARLEAEKVTPSAEADRPTLIRRLSLDLLGLAPAPEEIRAFIGDTRPDAYDRLVESFLASPHFGERWGRHWLDLARYADSEGYQVDRARPYAYVYRNWVIDAVNRDLPYNQFTIEQLAGDLLPNATQEQRTAAGFHRNTLMNHEDGVDREEFRCKAKADRVATTGTVWLGLTLGCAECHSHKYDPITQKEFYGMYAFFNNAEELDFPAPQPGEAEVYAQRRKAREEETARLKSMLADFNRAQLPANQRNWEQSLRLPLTRWTTLQATNVASMSGTILRADRDRTVKAGGRVPSSDTYIVEAATDLKGITGFRLEVLPAPGRKAVRNREGRFILSEFAVELERPGCKPRRVVLQNATADLSLALSPVSDAIDGISTNGWAAGDPLHRHVAVFETREELDCSGGAKLSFKLVQESGWQMTIGRFRLAATTSARPNHASLLPDSIVPTVETPESKRSAKQREEIARYYREEVDPFSRKLNDRLQELAKATPQYVEAQAQSFRQSTNYTKTFVHVRGDFLRKGDEVRPGVLGALHPFKPRCATPDRLDLARWLVDPANPLTSRVTVNRLWQHLFGRGIVATAEDFGVRGDLPSHPEMLDWLATEFMRLGWSRKEIIRLIVSSATYRQSANARPELATIDSNNILLARQNRFRVEAEIVRDLYLSSGGLLNQEIKGPSFRPPTSDDFKALGAAGAFTWVDSEGPEKYKRGLYIFSQRTVPYPVSMTFDSPNPNESCPRRETSTTPLQALTLLNNPIFFEATQGLARRMLLGPGRSEHERIAYGFECCLGRRPTAEELTRLERLFHQTRSLANQDRQMSATLLGNIEIDQRELADAAGYVLVAQVLTNLDEFLTRE